MKFYHSKIPVQYLIIAAILIISATIIFDQGQKIIPTSYYEQQIAAAQQMRRCIDSLKFASIKPVDKIIDPNQTNLIGVEYSPITTTLGNLKAKRSSTNPDFAALIVRWFHEIDLKKGDIVAIGCSGSFPALILATTCAAEVMELEPVIIPSLGASSYGANRPNFTYLDIENFLFQKGLIKHRSVAASLGGAGDIASDLGEIGRELIRQAILRNDIQLIEQPDFDKNIQIRSGIYEKNGQPRLFINIGGAQINVGDYDSEKRLSPGINRIQKISSKAPQSMAAYFANKGIPIIHLLGIEKIASQYHLLIDPIPHPESDENKVYFDRNPPFYILIISISLFFMGIFIIARNKKSY